MLSPVVKPATIRIVFSLVVSFQWPIHQLDVKNDFLNDDLSKIVYMHQPPGFVDNRYPHHVCLLQRSLYGMKTAPRVLVFSDLQVMPHELDFIIVVVIPHCLSIDRVLRFVFVIEEGTLNLGLHLYASSTTSLVGYTDDDWAGCPSTRSAEAEYRGVANVYVAETCMACNLFVLEFSTCALSFPLNIANFHQGWLRIFEEFRSSLSVRPPPAPTTEAY
ncbi:ribonuclease H-like domain-containing protein [Tanacetum coccineum]|uniref:Ribonuclease H-like domain-containing protein n=1 Tax=Tanacetum coccineum TaxID=301880 RepID=A0ABQ4YN33_9ASTR